MLTQPAPSAVAPDFGADLKRLRLAAGLSQEQLAERARLSPQAISALESGARRSPHRDTVERLAMGLRLTSEQRARLEAAVRRGREARSGRRSPPEPESTTPDDQRPPGLPTGTVTFLYTDLEGSTGLWEQYPAAMRTAMDRHMALLRSDVSSHGGQVFRTVGDGICAAFATASAALAAALAAQRALLAEPWWETGPLRVRMALHTGAAEVQAGDYVGAYLNRIGRMVDVAYGGQVLLSQATTYLVREVLPAQVGLLDLGEHRLRDLALAERIYQLLHPDLPADFPPLRSLTAARHNLPVQLTSLVGREQEVAAVRQVLDRTRLLTLTGTGGCGKTRLALQAAADLLERYPDGVWFVDLAPLTDPVLVAAAAAAALGIREQPGQPLFQTLVQALLSKRLLILLDNCEHLLPACAELADALLRGCPGVQILATSREALSLAGEVPWRVPSLDCPDPGAQSPVAELAGIPAVRLFCERAAASARFALTPHNAAAVAQLCQRLDGIPLALELAAARLRVLGLRQLTERLDECFRLLTSGSRAALPRQKTLRAAIDWSYELLEEPERLLFQRLAVFAGSFTLEAAEAVCAGDGLGQGELLEHLTRLVDKSLLQAEELPDGTERYRLLETLREYGRERLEASGGAAGVRNRHAAFYQSLADAVYGRYASYYLALTEAAATSQQGPREATWQSRLEPEHDNLRAALRWLMDSGAIGPALQLVLVLAGYCAWRGYVAEGRTHVGHMLQLARRLEPSAALANLLSRAAQFAHHEGDYAAEHAYRQERLAVQQALDDREGVAHDLSLLGVALRNLGDHAASQAALDEALTRHRTLGDRQGMAHDLIRLGELAQDRGDYALAQRRYDESRSLGQGLDDLVFAIRLPHHVGSLALARGDVATARPCFLAGLSQLREHQARDHNVWYWAHSALADFAALAAAEGLPERAFRLAGAVERIGEVTGALLQPTERQQLERWLAVARQALPEEAAATGRAEGRALGIEQAVAYALEDSDAREGRS